MHILVVFPSGLEAKNFEIDSKHTVEVLVSGVGGFATMYSLTKYCALQKPDYIIPEVEAIATKTLVELEKEGYNVITMDALEILNFIKKNGRSDKNILFGHSMGSLRARNVIQ